MEQSKLSDRICNKKFVTDTAIVIGMCSIATAYSGQFEPKDYCGIGPAVATQVAFYVGLIGLSAGILGHFLHKSKLK